MLPADLREVLSRLPDTSSVTLSVTELRELVAHLPKDSGGGATPRALADLSTTATVCARYDISAKTLERRRKAGLFPGAAKKKGHWYYPASALRFYEQWLLQEVHRKRNVPPAETPPDSPNGAPDLSALGAWREEARTDDDR